MMRSIDPEFSAMQGRAEEAASVEGSRQEAGRPENDLNQQKNKTVGEKTEEGLVTTSKEAPSKSAGQGKTAEADPVAAPATISTEEPMPTASGEKRLEVSPRSTVSPRRNIIPSRPTSFGNGNRTPSGDLKTIWPTEGGRQVGADFNKQAAQNASAEIEARHEHREEARDAADLLTGLLPSVTAQNPQANAQLERQERLADEPTRELPAREKPSASQDTPLRRETQPRERQSGSGRLDRPAAAMESRNTPLPDSTLSPELSQFVELPTTPLPATLPVKPQDGQKGWLTRGRASFLALLLAILVINASATGFSQFFGPQGWGSAFNGPSNSRSNLLNQLQQQLRQHTPTSVATGQPTAVPLTPTQIVNALMANMTLDQKLGQMLMVRFASTNYSQQLSAMISQYHVGSVIEYQSNIVSKSQLITLNDQIQHSGDLPMIVAIDQEGGSVDRLINLDGAQPSASAIGATGNPNMAYQQGLKDAQDLASYGFNLNLAPVVDVHTVDNLQLAGRTYGSDPTLVTEMAGAYLKGLQQSGKVLGTIKHFPGLGDVSSDPHLLMPDLTRSLEQLNAIDWVPYKKLISQGDVYSIMVTHELVNALDANTPSSLSPKVIGILRNQLGFQGVIITDGLTMNSIISRYTLGQAAVMAVEAGNDLLMDPGSPDEVAQMVDALKQAISSGAISQQRIDDSVRRILLFKYQMGLLRINS